MLTVIRTICGWRLCNRLSLTTKYCLFKVSIARLRAKLTHSSVQCYRALFCLRLISIDIVQLIVRQAVVETDGGQRARRDSVLATRRPGGYLAQLPRPTETGQRLLGIDSGLGCLGRAVLSDSVASEQGTRSRDSPHAHNQLVPILTSQHCNERSLKKQKTKVHCKR